MVVGEHRSPRQMRTIHALAQCLAPHAKGNDSKPRCSYLIGGRNHLRTCPHTGRIQVPHAYGRRAPYGMCRIFDLRRRIHNIKQPLGCPNRLGGMSGTITQSEAANASIPRRLCTPPPSFCLDSVGSLQAAHVFTI